MHIFLKNVHILTRGAYIFDRTQLNIKWIPNSSFTNNVGLQNWGQLNLRWYERASVVTEKVYYLTILFFPTLVSSKCVVTSKTWIVVLEMTAPKQLERHQIKEN